MSLFPKKKRNKTVNCSRSSCLFQTAISAFEKRTLRPLVNFALKISLKVIPKRRKREVEHIICLLQQIETRPVAATGPVLSSDFRLNNDKHDCPWDETVIYSLNFRP